MRRQLGRLDDHGVAHRQGRRHLPGDHLGREVPRDHRADHADRRRRRGDPLELPGPDGRLEARPGARDRQHRGHQARVARRRCRLLHRGARRRGRAPGRRAQRRDRAGRRRRRGDRPPPGHRLVAFTGSTEVGRQLPRSTRRESNLKRVLLELGGKSPQVVFGRRRRPRRRRRNVAVAIFWNMGENCCAGSRLIVHRSVKDRAARGRSRRARRPGRVGDPLDPRPQDRRADRPRPHGAGPAGYIDIGRARGRTGRHRRRAGPRGDRRLVRPADDLRRRPQRHADRPRGDLRAGPVGHRVRHRGRGDRDRERHAVRPRGLALHPTTSTSPTGSPGTLKAGGRRSTPTPRAT